MFEIILRLISLVILIIILPLLVFVSFLILIIDKNNPIFIQERMGKNNKVIRVYKFRTLKVNEATGIIHSVRVNDGRITKLGSFLRTNNIDELLQIINVLKGDMNFVGPRPLAISQDQTYRKNIRNWDERYKVKPGITGLSQSLKLSGGDDIKKYQLISKIDSYYVKKRSIVLDLKIISKTVKSLFFVY